MIMNINIIYRLSVIFILSNFLTCCSKPKSEKLENADSPSSEKPETYSFEKKSQVPQIDNSSQQSANPTGRGEYEGPANPSYKNLPPLIGSGVSKPDPVIPPVAEKIRREIEKEFGGLQGSDPRISSVFRKLWSRTWPNSFNLPTKDSQTEEIATGKMLPAELVNFRISSKEFVAQVQKGMTGNFSSDEELEAAYLMLTLSIGDARSGARNLFLALSDRSNQLPPSRGDVVLFNIVIQALQDMKQGGASAISFDDLKPLAESKNPIYRLIALRASSSAVTEQTRFASSENSRTELEDAPARTAFYGQFFKEIDPQILSEAVLAMAAVPSREAMTLLRGFRQTQQIADQPQLVAIADDAILTCEATLKAFHVGD
jgi:hypothetical protein